MEGSLRVAVIGCGLIGRRRAAAVAADPSSELCAVADSAPERAQDLAATFGARAFGSWRELLDRAGAQAVIVSTPNGLLREIATEALTRGKHVLIEKPMGRSASEAESMAQAAERAGMLLKVGFNHRYHPALQAAHAAFTRGEIGALVNLRARYGHGSRPGCEREWRADPQLAGGGELLDQGVHVLDLFHWFAGPARRAFGTVQTAVWPLGPLEDNAFAQLEYGSGVVGQLHVSMTQWKNLFSLELAGVRGTLVVEGLGGSYGTERLTVVRRNLAGGVPDVAVQEFPGEDRSWQAEWADFRAAAAGTRLQHGRAADGVQVMRTAEAIYRSARSGRAEPVAAAGVTVSHHSPLG